MTDQPAINWHALAKRHNEISAGLMHGINGQDKTDLYGADFDAEVMRRTIDSFRPVDGSPRLISAAEADDMVERAIRTWKFNATQHERAAENYKQLWIKAQSEARGEAFKEFADNLRQTAHSAKGKLRHEERLAIAEWLDLMSQRERRTAARAEAKLAEDGAA